MTACVCSYCADADGRRLRSDANISWHIGECCICKKNVAVTKESNYEGYGDEDEDRANWIFPVEIM